MENRPSYEANSYSADLQICSILWKPKFHYCIVQKALSLVPILSQMNYVHNLENYFFKIHFNITLPSTPISSTQSLSFEFSY
jgi:hypothetical protein